MLYQTTQEHEAFRQKMRGFAESEVKPIAFMLDQNNEFPAEAVEKLGKMGLMGIPYPKEYGGAGMDILSYAIAVEELSRVDGGAGVILSAHVSLGSWPIFAFGNEAQKKKAFEKIIAGDFGAFALTEPQAGSDASNVKTTARREGDSYVLNGRKCFITNGGVAGIYLIMALTDKTKGLKGMSAFIVEAGTPGLSTGKHEDKMGIRCSNTCDVVMDECRIPAENLLGKEGEGFKIAMQVLDIARTFVGCLAVGIAQRAMNEAVAYGRERIQFGKPIVKNQAIAFKIADMEIQIETARQMVAHSCRLMDMGLPYGKESAIAKCYCSDIAMKVASEAIQIFGGYGYSREYPVEKLLRDAKIHQIFEGTNEIQRVVISNHILR